jgi:shikimate kinase
MNIALIGFMGTGKTTVGMLLAKTLGIIYVDSDEEIIQISGRNITDLFAEYGETRFRELETDTVYGLSQLDGVVIGCGGGVAVNPENVVILHKTSKVVLLTASPEEILRRTSGDFSRPLLNTENRLTRIRELMAVRISAYLTAADLVVDTGSLTPQEVVDQILRQLVTLT